MSETNKLRVRFAPSPTGLLHVGNARTALYNWLVARHVGADGVFILRVEDTDLERSEARFEAQLIEDLRWLGLGWDEGPVAYGGSGEPGAKAPDHGEGGNAGLKPGSSTGNQSGDAGSSTGNQPGDAGTSTGNQPGDAGTSTGNQQPAHPGDAGLTPGSSTVEATTEFAGEHGPYRQSERLGIYREHVELLLREGKAYRCFCVAEELEAERKAAKERDEALVYSGRCRGIAAAESEERAATERFAVRLNLGAANGGRPLDFDDVVRGHVSFDPAMLSDPVIVRAAAQVGEAGMPLYNFVVVVDDALMEITHVIRGDDHISNTPRQVAVYRAFGWPVPVFAHLSTILGGDRARLSKRHGATSIATFREMGYLPEALVNYLALLGWAPTGGDREIFSPEELVREFDLRRVTPSPAVFDFDKLNWINRQYLKRIDVDRLMELALPYFPQVGPGARGWFEKLLALLIPNVDRLDQLGARARFLFEHDVMAAKADAENAAVLASAAAQSVLSSFATKVAAEPGVISAERFKALVNEVKAETGVKGKELFHPIRIALTGSHSGPEFEKIVPLMEEGSSLGLGIASVRERVRAFVS